MCETLWGLHRNFFDCEVYGMVVRLGMVVHMYGVLSLSGVIQFFLVFQRYVNSEQSPEVRGADEL
jgi:hypothetical protein